MSTWPGRARPGTTPELRRTSDAGYTSRSNISEQQELEQQVSRGLMCIVKEFPRKFESMRYLVTCSGCSAASRLRRLRLSACGAQQAAPMHAYRRPLASESTASTLRQLWRRRATLLIRLGIQLDYSDVAVTLTLTLAADAGR